MNQTQATSTENDKLLEQSRHILNTDSEQLFLQNRTALAKARAAALTAREQKHKGKAPWLISAAAVAGLSAVLLLPISPTPASAEQTVDLLENMDMLLWMNEHPEVL